MKFGAWFADFSFISALIVAYCYFVGWFLIYFFLQEFDIEILQIEIPQLYFLFYSYAVIEHISNALIECISKSAWKIMTGALLNPIVLLLIGIIALLFIEKKIRFKDLHNAVQKFISNSLTQFIFIFFLVSAIFYYGYFGAFETAKAWAKDVRFGNQNQIQLTTNGTLNSSLLEKVISRKISLKRSRCLADREKAECIKWRECQDLIKLHGVYRIGDYHLSTIIADVNKIFILYQPKCGTLINSNRAAQAAVIELKYKDISSVTHNLSIFSIPSTEGR